jgi:hypothetical protein
MSNLTPTLKPTPWKLLASAFGVCLLALCVACGDSDSDSDARAEDTPSPPTTAEQLAYCREVAATTKYLQDMKSALGPPLDQVALVESRANARASLDYLYSASDGLQGGADALTTLTADLNELNRLFATQDLAGAADEIRAQVDVVAADLESMNTLGGCT